MALYNFSKALDVLPGHIKCLHFFTTGLCKPTLLQKRCVLLHKSHTWSVERSWCGLARLACGCVGVRGAECEGRKARRVPSKNCFTATGHFFYRDLARCASGSPPALNQNHMRILPGSFAKEQSSFVKEPRKHCQVSLEQEVCCCEAPL